MADRNNKPKDFARMERWLNKIICADCLEVIKQMPDKCVDLVLTDPPYNASNSNISFGSKHYRCVNEKWDKGFTPDFVDLAFSKIKDGGSLLVFCSYHLLGQYLTWKQPQQILHWAKTNPFPAAAKVYTPNIEYVLWWTQGNPYTFNKPKAKQNILWSSICAGHERTEHPTQKPLSIIRKLIQVHTDKNQTVLDCYLGSGTTAIAAAQLGRNFIGVEISTGYCRIAEERLRLETAQLNMFVNRR
jgi:DNA modification methylase